MSRADAVKEAGQRGWIALYTKPNEEMTAVANVERQGYQAYCPLVMRRRSHARNVDFVRRPLFPCYAFVKLSEHNAQWRVLLSTRGVRTVVRFGERLGFMPEGFVEQLQAFEEAGMLRHATAPRFVPGDAVQVIGGPFRDIIAEVLSVSENDRVWLLLEIMGRAVRIQHDAWQVESCRV